MSNLDIRPTRSPDSFTIALWSLFDYHGIYTAVALWVGCVIYFNNVSTYYRYNIIRPDYLLIFYLPLHTYFMYEFITSPILQMILSALIVVCVLFQHSEKGMDGAFGGSSVGGESVGTTKRGFELTLYRATLFFSIILAGSLIIKVILG